MSEYQDVRKNDIEVFSSQYNLDVFSVSAKENIGIQVNSFCIL